MLFEEAKRQSDPRYVYLRSAEQENYQLPVTSSESAKTTIDY